jgi:hypothetical protein
MKERKTSRNDRMKERKKRTWRMKHVKTRRINEKEIERILG